MSDKHKKVLVIGEEASDFIGPLFKKIRTKTDMYIGILELREKGRDELRIKDGFDQSHTIRTAFSEYSSIEVIKALFDPRVYVNLLRFRSIKEAIRYRLKESQAKKIFENYDTFNIHAMSKEALFYIPFIPRSKKLVLSFWGSDLLDPNDNYPDHMIREAVERANGVTVHSITLREIFLSRFGRRHYDKVVPTLLFDDVDHFTPYNEKVVKKNEIVLKFKQKHGIGNEQTIIVIGHNATMINNHIEIVNALANLNEDIKTRISLVFPLTYGHAEKNYTQNLKDLCSAMNLNHVMLTEFLSQEELIELRVASEIHIRMPKFDAFSLALCETIYCNNIIISASWLPYRKMRTNGIYYHELDRHEELTGTVTSIMNNFDQEIEKHSSNNEAVLSLFNNENAAGSFIKVLD
jgi:hypothetical protein